MEGRENGKQVTKTGCKVGLLAGATIATGGSSMSAGTAAATVVGGVIA